MRFSGSSRARQRHRQAVDLLADDRAGRGHPVGRPTTPSPSTSTTSFPSAAHAPPATPAQHAHCATSPPPAAANRSKPKHSRCGKSCNRPRRPSGPASSPTTGGWPVPLFLPLPQRPVAGPPRPATTATPSRQTSDPCRCGPPFESILVPHPAPRHVDSTRQRAATAPRPTANPAAPTTPYRTLAASNPTMPPLQRWRPNRGAPLRAAPMPGPAAPSHHYRRGAPPRDRPGGPPEPSSPCCREAGTTESRPVSPTNLIRTHAVLLQPCSALTHGSSGCTIHGRGLRVAVGLHHDQHATRVNPGPTVPIGTQRRPRDRAIIWLWSAEPPWPQSAATLRHACADPPPTPTTHHTAHRHLGHPNSTASPNITPLALRSRNDNANSSVSN